MSKGNFMDGKGKTTPAIIAEKKYRDIDGIPQNFQNETSDWQRRSVRLQEKTIPRGNWSDWNEEKGRFTKRV